VIGTRPGGVSASWSSSPRPRRSGPIREFWTELAVALGILGIVLIGAAWLQVQLGLRPLKTIRACIEAVRSGKEVRLKGAFPSEVEPLVVEVNDLLRSQEASIAFARARAADLAHGLKTPLAVLATTSSGLRARGDEETAALVEEMTGDMADRVDYQLRLSRLRLRTRTEIYSASLQEEKTIGALKRRAPGEESALGCGDRRRR
jgi:signal transduction histidine kinase